MKPYHDADCERVLKNTVSPNTMTGEKCRYFKLGICGIHVFSWSDRHLDKFFSGRLYKIKSYYIMDDRKVKFPTEVQKCD